MLKKILTAIPILILLYLLFWPVPYDVETFDPLPHPGYEGTYATNTKLSDMTTAASQCLQCEDVDIWRNRLVGGQLNGKIVVYEGQNKIEYADTGGRPLGLAVDTAGNLIIADAYKGLLMLDSSGTLTTLTTESDGIPFKFADDVDIAPDGKIYFSDASSKFEFDEVLLEGFLHSRNGRLLVYDPVTKMTKTLISDLCFANGVAVSQDGSFVLVNETFGYRIHRHWLKGPKAGTSDIFKENLPGFPDGISLAEDGNFWLAVISQRVEDLDKLLSSTFIRKIMLRLNFLPSAESYHNMVLGLDTEGNVIHNFQDPNPSFHELTSVHQVGNTLYFGSLASETVGQFTWK